MRGASGHRLWNLAPMLLSWCNDLRLATFFLILAFWMLALTAGIYKSVARGGVTPASGRTSASGKTPAGSVMDWVQHGIAKAGHRNKEKRCRTD